MDVPKKFPPLSPTSLSGQMSQHTLRQMSRLDKLHQAMMSVEFLDYQREQLRLRNQRGLSKLRLLVPPNYDNCEERPARRYYITIKDNPCGTYLSVGKFK
jgi:hypothetical protein